MKFELKMALRFMASGKSQTIFIIVGIAVGVAVQIFLGSLINSLQDSLVDETIGNSSHITIRNIEDTVSLAISQTTGEDLVFRGNQPLFQKNLDNWALLVEEIAKEESVTAISPTLQGTALVKSSGRDRSVQIKGVVLEDADRIYDISSRMVLGLPVAEGNTILIGATLAQDLSLTEGDSLNVLLPNGSSVRLIIGGIYDLQNEAANGSLLFMDLRRAQKLFNTGDTVSSIETQITDPFEADVIASQWKQSLGNVKVEEWMELNQQLLSALSSQSSSSYTIQFFVILSITLGIASVLAVSVIQKSKEIGILKAMGATKKTASQIFILQGFLLGMAGSIAGIGLGILLLTGFNSAEGLSFSITYEWRNILLLAVIATSAGAIASVIPARRSANLNPMEAIKNG
ncbi:MAG: ABC transporter permease [Clostridia bacterium]|nr:ABC transporter permease [Clostridia bacterium]HPD89877.1 ABC transporter permease [Bacillota bacterium]